MHQRFDIFGENDTRKSLGQYGNTLVKSLLSDNDHRKSSNVF